MTHNDRGIRSGYGGRYNLPYFAFLSAIGIVAYAIFSNNDRVWQIVPLIVPALLGSAFAERNARDIRNGTVEDKARKGTHKALQEAGVVTRDGPVVTESLQALHDQTAALNETLEALAILRKRETARESRATRKEGNDR